MKRTIIFATYAIAFVTSSAMAAETYPNAYEGKAKIACDAERDLVFARKLDLAPKYFTDGFIDHNTMMSTTGLKPFVDKMTHMPKFGEAGPSCPPSKVVLISGEYVVFVRELSRPDPKDSAKIVHSTHFDVWRFEGKKIAEHWD